MGLLTKLKKGTNFRKITLLNCPNSKGYWELIDLQSGSSSTWNVLFNNNWPLPGAGGWIATNGIRTCMCTSLKGKWRKVSNMFRPGEDIGNSELYKNVRIKKGL